MFRKISHDRNVGAAGNFSKPTIWLSFVSQPIAHLVIDHIRQPYVTWESGFGAASPRQRQSTPDLVGSVKCPSFTRPALARISHNVLNANHMREVDHRRVWTDGAVTAATSMAGQWDRYQTRSRCCRLCGLIVIKVRAWRATNRDLQIRGRSGRQGDPGMSQFFVSFEDDVIKVRAVLFTTHQDYYGRIANPTQGSQVL